MIFKTIFAILLFSQTLFLSINTQASQFDPEINSLLEDELMYLQAESMVSIASKKAQFIGKAPAIVTVITAREIKKRGFQTLTEALASVPGVDLIKDGAFGSYYLWFRGSDNDGQIKILLDGHSLNDFYSGTAFGIYYNLPLKFVKKIEVIRGPGSALYGENAFTGVIDIISKDIDDIDGMEFYTGFGDYNTKKGGVMGGKSFGDMDITAFVDWHQSDGINEMVEKDRMSDIDDQQEALAQSIGLPYARSSNAPGSVKDSSTSLDLMVKALYKKIKFLTHYRRAGRDPLIGSDYSLIKEEDYETDKYLMNLSYIRKIGDKIEWRPRVFYDNFFFKADLKQFPPGTTLLEPPFGSPQYYPIGIRGAIEARMISMGVDLQLDYQVKDNHSLILGFLYQKQEISDVKFTTSAHPITLESFNGDMIEVSSTLGLGFLKENERSAWSGYVQHMWDIRKDMNLTLGLRHDQYNDFGGTTNPRVAYVWEISDDVTLKALYGQAFRAPSGDEVWLENQPLLNGNENLKPETITTYEFGLSRKFADKYTLGGNYFYSAIREKIKTETSEAASQKFVNKGGLNIQGVEIEAKVSLNPAIKKSYLFANYTYTDPVIDGSTEREANMPANKGNVGINMGNLKYLNINIHTYFSDSRRRAEGDSRDPLPAYTLTNLHVIGKNIYETLELKLKINNIFNNNYVDPSPYLDTRVSMYSDLPRPDRNFFAELSYRF